MDIGKNDAMKQLFAAKPAAGFDNHGLLSLKGNESLTDKDKIATLAKEFESIFLAQALKTMRATIPESGFLEKGAGEELFTSMMDEEIARQMSYSGGGMGLAAQLTAQLTERLNTSSSTEAKIEGKKDE